MEVLIAPEYDDEALGALRAKEALADPARPRAARREPRATATTGGCSAGFLVQDADAEVDDREGMKVVTEAHPDEAGWGDLLFAWRVAKHVASNAIVIAKDLQMIGIGGGQTSRVDAVRLALEKAAEHGHDLDRRRARVRRLLPVPGRAPARARRGRQRRSSSPAARSATPRSSRPSRKRVPSMVFTPAPTLPALR